MSPRPRSKDGRRFALDSRYMPYIIDLICSGAGFIVGSHWLEKAPFAPDRTCERRFGVPDHVWQDGRQPSYVSLVVEPANPSVSCVRYKDMHILRVKRLQQTAHGYSHRIQREK